MAITLWSTQDCFLPSIRLLMNKTQTNTPLHKYTIILFPNLININLSYLIKIQIVMFVELGKNRKHSIFL